MTRRLMLLGPSRLSYSLTAWVIVCLGLLLQINTSTAHAQVTATPGVGSLGTQVNPVENIYKITEGTRAGSNLFHSFGEFSVGALDTARFQTGLVNPVADATVSNILGRVTGGNPSSLFGTIDSASYYPSANLFLMNPAGIVFGPNATLNVGGSVTFTTANYLRLVEADGTSAGLFHANLAEASLLTAAPVAAFGFLSLEAGVTRGEITVQGSALSVPSGQSITLVGGDVVIGSGVAGETAQAANVSAPNGQIRLASANSPGEFLQTDLSPTPNINGVSFTSYGSVHLAPGSTIDVSGTNTVSIRSGQFVLSINDAVLTTAETPGGADSILLSRGSSVVTSNSGTEPGADVAVATGNLQIDGASLKSTTTSEGRGGDVSITAESISLVNGAQIVSATEGPGTGGTVTLTATDNVSIFGFDIEGTLIGIFDDGGFVRSGVFSTTSSSGRGGAITVSAPALTLEEGGTIVSTVSGEGRGGNITVGGNTLNLLSGAQIVSTSGVFDFETEEIIGSGPGGDITVTASDSVLITGVNPDLFSLSTISTTTSTIGKGGDITISAPNVTVEGSSAIVSSTAGEGTGGALKITATETVLVTGFTPDFLNSAIVSNASSGGAGGAITIDTPSLLVHERGVIQTESSGPGDGGALIVTAENISLTSGGGIEASGGVGASGKITLATEDTLLVSGQFVDLSGPLPDVTRSRIVNRTTNGSGDNGGIEISARDVLVTGGRIESQTGAGGGGNVSITAVDAITISGGLNIQAFTLGGTVGSLMFSAPAITLLDNATVGSTTASNANAGDIQFFTNTLRLMDGSIIRSNTEQGTGRGGAIVVDASDSVFLSGGSTIQSNTTTSQGGPAGSVTVKANNLVSLTDAGTGLLSESGSSTSMGTGNGGTITVLSNQVQITNGAVISAKSNGTGSSGSITIEGRQNPAQSVLITGPGSGLFTETEGTGTGGNITAWANQVQITNGATVSSKTTSSGNAGNILVKADTFRMEGGATITAASTGSGNAGTVTVQGTNSPANSVVIEGTGTGIFTDTQDSGKGGDITIQTKTLTIQNGGTISAATSGLDKAAIGGDITVTAAQSVDLRNNAFISARSTGEADAGNITINAGKRFEARNSSVTTKSEHAGGGNIEINALDQIRLVNSQVNASAFLDGGNISIDPNVVILQNSQILAQAIQGAGGNITITTPLFLADSSSLVSASSQFGLNGTVTIQSPTSNLSGSLGTLTSKPGQAQSLLTQRCAALANGQASSFVVAGREQLPADPGGWLSGPIALAGIDAERFGEGTVAEGTSHLEPRTSGLLANDRVSLRRLTPAGFLIANFADSEATGCHS